MGDTLDYGAGVSRTLPTSNRAFSTVVWQQGKPPLDSELNLQFDISEYDRQELVRAHVHSGFVNCQPFTFSAVTPNTFSISADEALVNGWRIHTLFNGDNTVTLPISSTGLGNHRNDLVFLEVWKVELTGGSTSNKPDATHIYKDGNVQNVLATLADDIRDTVIGFETTKRVQIQYRYRVQSNIGTPNSQLSNVFTATTYAQGATASPVASYSFTNMGSTLGDYGLYRAGNGDAASRLQLGTVDGYVYALPIAVVARRSIASYNDEDVNGQFASSVAIGGTSDRIDGLFYDSVTESDVTDLRHQTVLGKPNYQYVLKTAINDLLTGKVKTHYPSRIVYDLISNTALSGYTIFNSTTSDGVRNIWSDLQTTVVAHVAKLNIGNTDTNKDWFTSRATGSWTIGDTLTVNQPDGSPLGTIITGSPTVYYNAKGLIAVTGAWSGVGTNSAVFTLGTNTLLTSQEIWITFDVRYPNNEGTTYIPDQLLKLEYKNVASFPNIPTSYTTYYGVVRAGTNLLAPNLFSSRNSKQVAYKHAGPVNDYRANYTLNSRNKEILLTPVVASTTAVDGANKVMSVKNFNSTSTKVSLTMPTTKTWFVRGVYKTASGNFTQEIATTQYINENPSSVVGNSFFHPRANHSFARISSIIYDPGVSNLQLIVESGGDYYPVFRQDASGNINEFILVDTSGNTYTPPTTVVTQYQITYMTIPTANVNAYTVSSNNPADNWIQCDNNGGTVADGQELWIDFDYITCPHDGAQIKIAYSSLPYQGLVSGTTVLSATLKELSSFVHTDGTANVTANIDTALYPRPLISYFPTPVDIEFSIKGDSVAGSGIVGESYTNPNCYVDSITADLAVGTDSPLKIGDIITAAYDAGLVAIERGGNKATVDKAIMLVAMSAPNYKQAVVFALGVAGDNFAIKDELVLYTWTYTINVATNKLVSTDGTSIGADMFFINKRPLAKIQ